MSDRGNVRRFWLPADDPELVKRYRLPTDAGIIAEDDRRTRQAQAGSAALLAALQSTVQAR